MDVEKLYFAIKFGYAWLNKWIAQKNIDHWVDSETMKKVPGESFRDYRIRLDEVSRKARELEAEIRKS